MTPFELSLESELTVEWQRFANEWLFKWHNLNIEGLTVDVDRFDGGRIRLGGIRFEGQPQQIFWQAVGQYLNQKIHDTFKRWDSGTQSYPYNLRRASIDGVERSLQKFVATIVARSTDTDRRLRGQGYPQNVQPFNSEGYQTRATAEILRLGEAHRTLLDESGVKEILVALSPKQRLENFLSNHKGIMAALGILIAIIGLLRFLL